MNKERIAVLFGGESSEHEISCISVTTIIKNIDTKLYEIILIGITKDGRWLLTDNMESIADGSWKDGKKTAVILPDKAEHGLLIKDGNEYNMVHIDVVFPVLHGPNGEDGTIQGLLEMSGIPYVGCGVLASSVAMDKLTTKKIVSPLNIRQAKYIPVFFGDGYSFTETADSVENTLSYPVFVKPANAGSSRGVSKACDRNELESAIKEAAKHDRRILVEEMIVGREVECAVIGRAAGNIEASGVGEIHSAAEFYDYDAKYNSDDSETVTDPELPEGVRDKIRDAAVKIFNEINGFGLSRVDFFVEDKTNDVVFNEINTMPGFTDISMYPILWESCGIDKKSLVGKLISMAKER